MSLGALLAAAVAAVLVLWVLGAHNRLMQLRNAIHAAWGQIDEQLRRRREHLPPLLAALREPLAAESATLDAVQAALERQLAAAEALRARPTAGEAVGALARAEAELASTVARLLALLDQQPAQRQRDEVGAALRELHDADLRLAFARQWFNDAVDAYNGALQQFPTRLLRPLLGLAPASRL